jgi:subtilisin family serine protease
LNIRIFKDVRIFFSRILKKDSPIVGAKFLVDLSGENNETDGYGHGTHVAGTIGSKTYGVAKNIKLYAVKVLDSDGSGTTSTIIAGFQYVAQNRTQSCPNGTVVNVSLGGPNSPSMNAAVCTLFQLTN